MRGTRAALQQSHFVRNCRRDQQLLPYPFSRFCFLYSKGSLVVMLLSSIKEFDKKKSVSNRINKLPIGIFEEDEELPKTISRKPPIPGKVVRRGEQGEEIAGKKYFHPNLEKVICSLATSPYQMKTNYYKTTEKITNEVKYHDLPPTVTKKFITAATYHISKVRRRFRTSLPYYLVSEKGAGSSKHRRSKSPVHGEGDASYKRLLQAQSNLIKTMDTVAVIHHDTNPLLSSARDPCVEASPIDKNASRALAKMSRSSNDLHIALPKKAPAAIPFSNLRKVRPESAAPVSKLGLPRKAKSPLRDRPKSR